MLDMPSFARFPGANGAIETDNNLFPYSAWFCRDRRPKRNGFHVPDIVTVMINPTVDIFVNVGRVEPTRKMRCSAPKRDPGGGINVARVAYRLGGDVTAIYPTGGAIGKLLQRLVEREGITSLVTPWHVETRESFTAFEMETGEQYRFVLPGSALHRAEWEACLAQLAMLPGRLKYVVASGSVPPACRRIFSPASSGWPSSAAPRP
jgi:fructose-1-phosphate kinase PfkB-like protein